MSRVVIVSRTRLGNRVCIGGHDIDLDMKSLRLLTPQEDNQLADSPLGIGDVWELEYQPRPTVTPPHVEDVLVTSGKRVERVPDLGSYLIDRVPIWVEGPEALWDGTLRATPNGRALVLAEGPIPSCSTGYWQPDHSLNRWRWDENSRSYFDYTGPSSIRRFSWAGVAAAPERIAQWMLVRVSLARYWAPDTAPAGYYAQISGVY